MRTEEHMKADLHNTRIAGDYVGLYTLPSGHIKKGSHVITPDGLAVVTGILIRPGEGVYVDVLVFGGNPNGQSFKPDQLRLATFREFCFNKRGFGRTPWIQVALALAALAFGTYRSIQTIDSGGVIGLVFIAMVLAWYTYWTWSNFKGRNA